VNSMCAGALVFILGAYASSMGRTTNPKKTLNTGEPAPPPLRA
jgi:hypothetical protein